MQIRFEIPSLRLQKQFEMDACPRVGEVVYLRVVAGPTGRRPFIVRHVAWYPEPDSSRDFQAYIVLGKNRLNN